MRAFVFPGQGSQKVGMGAELADASAAAREVFEEVDDALSQPLSGIMREGPEGELTLTENAQPAIMANAIATLQVLERDFGVSLVEKGDCVAGHSLGGETAWIMGGPDFDLETIEARCAPDCVQAELDAFAMYEPDPRVVGVVSLDGGLSTGLVADEGFAAMTAPVFWLSQPDVASNAELFARSAGADVTWVQLAGGCHNSFTGILGCSTLPLDTSLAITATYTLAFGIHTVLRERGYAVRRGDSFPGLGTDWVRIAVRDPHTTDGLLRELQSVLGDPAARASAVGHPGPSIVTASAHPTDRSAPPRRELTA